jgi:hypothetical protein
MNVRFTQSPERKRIYSIWREGFTYAGYIEDYGSNFYVELLSAPACAGSVHPTLEEAKDEVRRHLVAEALTK